jgi:helix-turn-helix protein
LRTTNRIELKTATVAIKDRVVWAVSHFLSAETLYRNLWIPIRNNAIIAKVYHLAVIGFPRVTLR